MKKVQKLVRNVFVLSTVFMAAGTAGAQESCYKILELSKTVQTVVSKKSDVEANARNFCSAYSSHRANASSTDFGASYKFLSATFGSTSASIDDVASRYCDAGQNYQARADSYDQYVETIAPGAYTGLQTCLDSRDVMFSVEGSTPTAATISYRFANGGVANTADLIFDTSPDVTCQWNNSKTKTQKTSLGGAGFLKCRRPKGNVNSYIVLLRSDGPAKISIPWVAYDSSGVPVDTVRSLTASMRKLQDAVQYNRLPVGTLLPWYSSNQPVPAGWVKCDGSAPAQCKDLRGKFLRGGASTEVGSTGGQDSVTMPWAGSDHSHGDGNGWSKDGDHFVPNSMPSINIIPSYVSVLYIMKVSD